MSTEEGAEVKTVRRVVRRGTAAVDQSTGTQGATEQPAVNRSPGNQGEPANLAQPGVAVTSDNPPGHVVSPVEPAVPEAVMALLEGCFLASDVRLDNIKILVYGDSGGGKTHFASGKGKGVLVLSLEVQGRATIRAANPQAQIFPCDNIDQLRKFIRLISIKGDDSPLKKAGIHTIVIDSMTELQQVLMEGILQEKRAMEPKEAVKKDGEKKDAAKGPAPEFTRNDWGTLAIKQRTFMRIIRDCPYNVVLIALCEPIVEENTGVRRLYPKIQGSFQENLPAYVNIIGYIYKGPKGERHVLVDGPEQYLCKSYGPIQGIVPADLMAWLDAIQKESPSIAIQGAKQPGQSGRRQVAAPPPKEEGKSEKNESSESDENQI